MTEKMSSEGVIAALRTTFPEPAHAWLEQLRDRTGYAGSRPNRYADALIVSCWPSRGIWFGGIEVKVSRQDWKRELEDPEKSAPIQSFCDYWWIAAPAGIVELAEVPETWGLLAIEGKRVKRLKEAPKLARTELTPSFVASILRNAAESQGRARLSGYDEGYRQATERVDMSRIQELEGKLSEAEKQTARAKQQLERKESEIQTLRASVSRFEMAAGLPDNSVVECNRYNAGSHAGATYRAAQLLRELQPSRLADRFAEVASALRAMPEVKS